MIRATLLAIAMSAAALLAGCEKTDVVQRGFRGLGMTQVYKPSIVASTADINQIPEPEPTDPPDPDAPPLSEVFKNVRVLNDLSALEFSRLMQAMSTWIAPEEGCEFCHNPNKLESDEKYTKVVARRMLQMTRHINTDWKTHVAGTGVTCWTCHRGNAVPSGDWFAEPGLKGAKNALGNRAGQNTPAIPTVGNTSLPFDPLSPFLNAANDVRVQGSTPLQSGNRHSIKQTEWTYGLMIYMSKSLGVNCTYCHNTRAMGRWEESSPPRATAWHGIRMVRDLNADYLGPLQSLLPPNRYSAEGDGPKVGCLTCHKGAFKPMYGASMLKDYPELAGAKAPAAAPSAPAAGPVAGSGSAPGVLGSVVFEPAAASLSAEAIAAIQGAASALRAHEQLTVSLQGFAERSGDAAGNMALATSRMTAVRNALAGAGVAEDRLVLGKPVLAIGGDASNSRRVDIVAAR